MRTVFPIRFTAVAILAILSFAGTANAQSSFQSMVDKAYAAYRTALFKTNANDRAATLAALDQADAGWAAVISGYRTAPPPVYATDPQYGASLDRVGALLKKARAESESGHLAEAHETLEGIRDTLSAMRERNGVIVFSDHVNAYHAEMERLIDPGFPVNDRQAVTELAGVLAYLDRQIQKHAPAAYRDDEKFRQLAADNHAAVERLRKGLASGDAAAIKAAIDGLKPAYSKLFLSFG